MTTCRCRCCKINSEQISRVMCAITKELERHSISDDVVRLIAYASEMAQSQGYIVHKDLNLEKDISTAMEKWYSNISLHLHTPEEQKALIANKEEPAAAPYIHAPGMTERELYTFLYPIVASIEAKFNALTALDRAKHKVAGIESTLAMYDEDISRAFLSPDQHPIRHQDAQQELTCADCVHS